MKGSNEGSGPAIPEEKLDRLLRAYGVEKEFIEFSGNVAQIALENRLNILAALGVSVGSEAEADRLLEMQERCRWEDWIEPVSLVEAGSSFLCFACREEEEDFLFQWHLVLEDGRRLEGEVRPADFPLRETRQAGARQYRLRHIPLPELPPGYHDLSLSNGEKWSTAALIAAPRRCYEPEWLQQGRRVWGLSAQLYSLCSEGDWGMGDFGDLRELIRQAADLGADFILLNPFHALDIRHPENASPYSPIDRRFLNPLYIDIYAAEDFQESAAARALVESGEFQRELAILRQCDQVDYRGVFGLKYRAYELMYRQFRQSHLKSASPRSKAFETWLSDHDDSLTAFGRFQADIGVPGLPSAADPWFHLYLQWLAEGQLESCQQLALQSGMKLGLVRDLAVGGGIDSCEVKTNPGLFCLDARIGAPPDNFNPEGQNWGLPPIRPDVLRQSRFAHYIALLRENMRSCGALRIDHVMGLMRLWWCPTDGTNAAGAYVRYPVDELFAILRLESQRARCVVVGEDLGVVPPEIRRYIDESGLLSNVIFYFEKYDGWHFKRPEHYPPRALAIIANHDVPTLKGWWNGHDLELRRQLGLIGDDQQLAREREHRRGEKGQVLQWLDDQNRLPERWRDRDLERPFDAELCAAILHNCGASASLLVSVQLDDVAGMESPVNVPGIGAEYPSWRRKIPIPLRELFQRGETRQVLEGVRQERP